MTIHYIAYHEPVKKGAVLVQLMTELEMICEKL